MVLRRIRCVTDYSKPCYLCVLVSVVAIACLAIVKSSFFNKKEQYQQEHIARDQSDKVPIIITFSHSVDLAKFVSYEKKVCREKIIRALKQKNSQILQEITPFLKKKHVKDMEALWIINGLYATVDLNLIPQLRAHPYIQEVKRDITLKESKLLDVNVKNILSKNTLDILTNIEKVGEKQLWEKGIKGKNVVVASMDTGVSSDVSNLASKWRGGKNSWYDPYYEHTLPVDLLGHGTNVMNIIVGGNGENNMIGIAPGAKWIAVKIFNDKHQAYLSAIHKGFQWLLDPDSDPNTDDAPDIINNSWGFVTSPSEYIDEFRYDIQILKLSGIIVVCSAGNNGPNSSSSQSPANYPETLSVGSILKHNLIAPFSSRGPSACDGKIYPDIVAPCISGELINSCKAKKSNNLIPYLGTSFAAPCVTGAIALLIEAFPDVNIDELEHSIKDTAIDLGLLGPDNQYGYGLMDVTQTYNYLSKRTRGENKK